MDAVYNTSKLWVNIWCHDLIANKTDLAAGFCLNGDKCSFDEDSKRKFGFLTSMSFQLSCCSQSLPETLPWKPQPVGSVGMSQYLQ